MQRHLARVPKVMSGYRSLLTNQYYSTPVIVLPAFVASLNLRDIGLVSSIVNSSEQKSRCWWCGDDELYQQYHDLEWGVPAHDERDLFEFLCLEGAQAGSKLDYYFA